MFGYITPRQAELNHQQRLEYQLFYCTLCHTLGKNYGWSSRMALSYDAALLAIMIVGMQESQGINQTALNMRRCPAAFWRKKDCLDSDQSAFIFAASAGLAAAAGKVLDNVQDEGRFYNRLLWKWIQPRYQKAQNTLPSQGLDLDMEAVISNQIEAERESLSLLDVAQQTSEMLGKIFAAMARLGGKEEYLDALYQLGSYTGRTIYILDACNDLPQDQRQCAYNAISACYDNACYQEKGKSISLKRTSHSGHRDLARIRSLVDSLSFGSRQQLVRRLLVTSLRNQAMSIFGYLPAAKRQPKFNPWRLLFDESGDIGACIGDICTCFCMLACIGYCCETCSGCCQGCCGSENKYSEPPRQYQPPRQEYPPNPPLCSYCGTGADVVYHPQKGWICLSALVPRLRQEILPQHSAMPTWWEKSAPIVRPP
jgi:hypothetical protein